MRGSWAVNAAGNWEGMGVGGSLFGDAVVDLVWQPSGSNGVYRATTATGIAALIASALASGAVFVRVWMDPTVANNFVFDAAFGHLKQVGFFTNPALAAQGQTTITISDGATCLTPPRYFGQVADVTVDKTDGPFCTVEAGNIAIIETAIGGGIHCETGSDAFIEVEDTAFLTIFGYARIGEVYDPANTAVVKCLGNDSGVTFEGRDGATFGGLAVDDGGFAPDISFSVTMSCTIENQLNAGVYSVGWGSDATVGEHKSMTTSLNADTQHVVGPASAYFVTTAARTHTLANPSAWLRQEYTVLNSNSSTHPVSVVRHDAGAFADGATSYSVAPGRSITFVAESTHVGVRHSSPGLPSGHLDGLQVTGTGGAQTASIAVGTARDSTDTVDIIVSTPLAIDMSVTGPGGRDTGAASNGVWYCFAAQKSDGTKAGFASLSPTAPTLTGDYVYFRLVGTLTYVSAAIVGTFQRGRGSIRETIYTAGAVQQGAATFTRVGAGLTTYADAINWASYIPIKAISAHIVPQCSSQANASYNVEISHSGSSSATETLHIDANGWPSATKRLTQIDYNSESTRTTTVSTRAFGAGTFTAAFYENLFSFKMEY